MVVIGILAQRLVRRVCRDCSVEAAPSDVAVDRLGAARLPADAVWRAGHGCPACHDLGYKGRLAIHELLEMTPDVRDLVSQRAPDHAIREAARRAGMRTLLEDGIAKAALGLTTLDEVLRVAPLSDTAPARDARSSAVPIDAGRLPHAPAASGTPPPASATNGAGVMPHPPGRDDGAGERTSETSERTRVLVVDDSPTVVEVVKYFLELEGYEVLVARDGLAGLELARRTLPDAVVSDVEMPEMDGKALVRALREDPLTQELPVMLLTSRTSIESEAEGLGAGADDYVPKPVEPRRLAARVKALLTRCRRPRVVAG